MNTPAHLIIGLATFGKGRSKGVPGAALIGAILPDLSLYLMSAWSFWVIGHSPGYVFGTLYYSTEWQRVFAVDNSLILWGIALTFAVWVRSARAIALTGAATLHIVLDFPLHNHDARMHFWPASEWVFISPFSYWDRAYHGNIIGPVEVAICAALLWGLWGRFRAPLQRVGLVLLALAELATGGIFSLIF